MDLKLVFCILVSAAGTAAVACTGFYVGRKVSADGTTIIARTVDSKPATCKRFEILPHMENVPGRHYVGNNRLAEWPLPATTYKAVVVPSVPWGLKAGRYDGACANEKGNAQRTALADTKRIFDELSWHLVKMNFNRGDFGNKKSIPERKPFAPTSN